MNYAVVTGGNGIVGRELTKELLKNDVTVIVIGTSARLSEELTHLKEQGIFYLRMDSGGLTSEELADSILRKCETNSLVFYNLAWRGVQSLTDGDLSDQIKNIAVSCEYLELARKINAVKFINAGSFEELVFERRQAEGMWANPKKEIRITDSYALAKVYASKYLELLSYVKRIDFCHTRISIVVGKTLQNGKFVENAMRHLIESPEILEPENNELCNIVSTGEIARQLVAIGRSGVNKTTYPLGTGGAASLRRQFESFASIAHENRLVDSFPDSAISDTYLCQSDFSTDLLTQHTGYYPQETPEALFREILGLK